MQTRQCSAHDVEQCWVCKIPDMYHNVHLGVALSSVEAPLVHKISGGPGLAIASMVLGIVALVVSCCFYYLSIPCAIIGAILGFISLASGKKGKGMAIAGVVCSIVSLIPAILMIIYGASFFSAVSSLV